MLEETIRRELHTSNAPMTFKRFMQIALYDPKDGFYTKHAIIGTRENSDFSTDPENYSPCFGASVAEFIGRYAAEFSSDALQLVEMGGGNGTLAVDILDHLQEYFPRLYRRVIYSIVEALPRLAQRQREKLQHHPSARVHIGSALDVSFTHVNGFFLSNELPDAFPVDIVFSVRSKGLHRLCITEVGRTLDWKYVPVQDHETFSYLKSFGYGDDLKQLPGSASIRNVFTYGVPVNLDMIHWYRSLAGKLHTGAVLTFDYGFMTTEEHLFASEQSRESSVRVYNRNSSDRPTDLLKGIGKRDITSDVNFAILKHVGHQSGLTDIFFDEQKEFFLFFGAAMSEDNNFIALVQGKRLPPFYRG